jgi:hypothetical protein
MRKVKKVKSIPDFFLNYVQLEQYVFKGSRGENLIGFIIFLSSNILFIHIITIVWEIFSNKPVLLYREYFGFTLTMWNAFSATIMTAFGLNFLRSSLRVIMVGWVVMISQAIFMFLYLKFLAGSDLSIFDFLIFAHTGFFSISPFLIGISCLASLNIVFKNMTRVALRIGFFVTPVIWLPDPSFVTEERMHVLEFNPLYYGLAGGSALVDFGVQIPTIPHYFGYSLLFLGLVGAVVFGVRKMSGWFERNVHS